MQREVMVQFCPANNKHTSYKHYFRDITEMRANVNGIKCAFVNLIHIKLSHEKACDLQEV